MCSVSNHPHVSDDPLLSFVSTNVLIYTNAWLWCFSRIVFRPHHAGGRLWRQGEAEGQQEEESEEGEIRPATGASINVKAFDKRKRLRIV